jgi:hypothetical protein
MAKSFVYSFKAVSIVAQLKDTIGTYTAGTPIDLTGQGFYDKSDSIKITPQAEYISGEVSAGGEDYVSVTNDETGTVTWNVGDMTPVHRFLVTVANGHKQGLNVKGISLTVTRKAVGAAGEIIYQASYGSIQNRAAEKGYGATQTGNSYQMRFEAVSQDIEEVV